MIISITELKSKIYKPKLYKEVINNIIYGQEWQKAIEEELQNLENYQTWVYNKLLLSKKAIRLKWIFKVKYNPNRSVARFKTRLVAQGFL